jgi:hypothetical protein
MILKAVWSFWCCANWAVTVYVINTFSVSCYTAELGTAAREDQRNMRYDNPSAVRIFRIIRTHTLTTFVLRVYTFGWRESHRRLQVTNYSVTR